MLESPAFYRLKTRLLSLGRPSVLRYLETVARETPPGRVLDVACGPGGHADAFPQGAFAFDTSLRYVLHARSRSRGPFCVMDATRIAFADGAFTLAFAVGLCHHLPDEAVRDVAREMRRVLRPGGRALFIEGVYPPSRLHPGSLLFRLDRGAHTRTREHVAGILRETGFRLVVPNLPGSFPYHRAVFSFEKAPQTEELQ